MPSSTTPSVSHSATDPVSHTTRLDLLAVGLDEHCQSCLITTLRNLERDVGYDVVPSLGDAIDVVAKGDSRYDLCLIGEESLEQYPDWRERLASGDIGLPLILVCKDDSVGPALEDLWTDVITSDEGESAAAVGRALRRAARERRMVDHLRRNQTRYQSLVESIPVVVFAYDRAGVFTYCEGHGLTLLGLGPEAFVGRSIFEIGLDAEHDHPGIRRVLEGETVSLTTLFGGRLFESITAPQFDCEGRVIGGIGVSIDVTERVVAEEGLRKSEERFKLAARATNDTIWDWDMETGFVWFNEHVLTLFGYVLDSAGVPMDWWHERIHPDDRARVVSGLDAAVVERRQHWSAEYRFRRADGTYAFVLDRGYLMQGSKGRVLRMIGAMADITARRGAEEALRTSEEKFRKIVETAQEGIWVTDTEGTTTFVNARMAEMLCRSQHDLIGCSVFDFADSGEVEELAERIARRKQGIAEQYDYRFVLDDGSSLWTIISANPITDARGATIGALCMVTDITPRKETEQALKEAHDRLEARVRERTAEIESMMQSLKEANVAQRRFVADASHDLRTPLTVIRAEVDLLLRSLPEDSIVRQPLLLVADEARRLESLAGDLLTQATIDSHFTTDTWMATRLDELLLEAVVSVQSISRDRGITWNIDIDDPVVIRCDVLALKRAITNVLENGVKYSPVGGAIDVSMTTTRDHVDIVCRDHGPGISALDLPHVFERFYRSDPTRSTPGTGLGLSIVRSVLEAHGGSASVESAMGGGTTVRLTLRRSGVEAADIPPA